MALAEVAFSVAFLQVERAMFHDLEKRHRHNVERLQSEMITPEFVRQPLSDVVAKMVETFADYFEDLGPRVVYVQYFAAPEMFVHFDDAVDDGFIRRFAIALRIRNAALSVEKSELIAEVLHRTYNALLLAALKSNEAHRAELYQEIQIVLTNYLQAYDRLATEENVQAAEDLARRYGLTDRQQMALAYVLENGKLTIQGFEGLCPERSRRTLQRDLKQMIDKGLLRSEGDTTQLVYQLGS